MKKEPCTAKDWRDCFSCPYSDCRRPASSTKLRGEPLTKEFNPTGHEADEIPSRWISDEYTRAYDLAHEISVDEIPDGDPSKRRVRSPQRIKEDLDAVYKKICESSAYGIQISQLRRQLPYMTHSEITVTLQSLKKMKKIYTVGKKSAARWYPEKGK